MFGYNLCVVSDIVERDGLSKYKRRFSMYKDLM